MKSVLAKIIWLLVILSIPLLGATLYYITEKKPH
ncbi:PLDc N-terminal domain-containing protein [Christiangramia echinicola]